MLSILILSHGELSKVIYETAVMVAGKVDNVEHMSLKEGDGVEAFLQDVITRINAATENGEVLVLTDMVGGSPMISAAKAISQVSRPDSVGIVTGFNLPMLLEVLTQRKSLNMQQAIKLSVDTGINGIKHICLENKSNAEGRT